MSRVGASRRLFAFSIPASQACASRRMPNVALARVPWRRVTRARQRWPQGVGCGVGCFPALGQGLLWRVEVFTRHLQQGCDDE